MTLTTAAGSGAPILGAAQQGDLILRPVAAASVAFHERLATVVVITQATNKYRVPIVNTDPTAAWVAEGAEISPSDATLAELTITPSKVAGLSIISRELANDTNPAAAEAVGDGLARDIARKIDQAFTGNLTAPAAPGLGSLTVGGSGNVQSVASAAGATWATTDLFAEAISKSEVVGATVTGFLAGPADALLMAKIKKATGSNEPLLGNDPTQPTRRQILGLPLIIAPDVPAGTVWALDSSRVLTVVREDVEVVADSSPFFTSDRVAARATARIGFGFPHLPGLVKITLTP